MNAYNDTWNRLNTLVDDIGLSVNAFAKSIGLERAEVLYRIKSGKNSLSKDLAEAITIKYCNVSLAWLLTGEGTMYIDGFVAMETKDTKKIPYYDSIVFDNMNFEILDLSNPLYYIEVPMLANCDMATLYVGESMKPEIDSGSIVTLKEIDLSLILPGEMYLIITDSYCTIKYVRTISHDDSLVRLVPRNREYYDEMVLSKSLIRNLYLVKGVITTKVL